jgi:hypothetical protein
MVAGGEVLGAMVEMDWARVSSGESALWRSPNDSAARSLAPLGAEDSSGAVLGDSVASGGKGITSGLDGIEVYCARFRNSVPYSDSENR